MTLRLVLRAVLVILGVTGCASARNTASSLKPAHLFDEHLEPGVVVVALTPSNVVDHDKFVEVQMSLVAKAVDSGPVLILISDADGRKTISTQCRKYGKVCDGIRRGVIRVLSVTYRGPWIRDYGPQMARAANGTILVLDAEYNDLRQQRELRAAQSSVSRERMSLLEKLERANERNRAALERRLTELAQWKDVYSDPGLQARYEDDEVPYYLSQAALRDPTFRIVSTGLAVDGGNLMQLGRGVCATTTDVVPANDSKLDIEATLRDTYGCAQVVYLAALPGPVIKHVDMFLLPVDERTVVLPTYDPRQEIVRRYWLEADSATRNLTMEAELAMSTNQRVLERAGFKVLRVPALLPQTSLRRFYFPTNLNALIRVDHRRTPHVLMPFYEELEREPQQKAFEIIQKAFAARGGKVSWIPADAVAPYQGAIHCLSLVLPYDMTVFADPRGAIDWEQWAAMEDKVTEQQLEADERLHGQWLGPDGAIYYFMEDGQLFLFDRARGKFVLGQYRVPGNGRTIELDPSVTDVIAEARGQVSAKFRLVWLDRDHLSLIDRRSGQHMLELARRSHDSERL